MHTAHCKELFKRRWEELSQRIQTRWGNLTPDELTEVGGDYDQFVSLLQARYGYSCERATEEVQQCMSPYVSSPA
ncbi:MAG: CsbD family protein [Candidatus Tectimicrobiota bacterium]